MTTHKGLIVGIRVPLLRDGKLGREEKLPMHIADIVKMCGMSHLSTREGPGPAEKTRAKRYIAARVSTARDALESKTHSSPRGETFIINNFR